MGLVILLAVPKDPETRIPTSLAMIALGGGGLYWSIGVIRRWYGNRPEPLARRIVQKLGHERKDTVSLARVIADLRVTPQAAQEAMRILEARGVAKQDVSDGDTVWRFPGLGMELVVRKCEFCGTELPVSKPITTCPHCGANVSLSK